MLVKEITHSEKIKVGMMKSRLNGTPNVVPFGYQLVRVNGKNVAMIDEEKARIVVEAFNMYAFTDSSINDIYKHFSSKVTRAKSNFARMFSNPFYYGVRMHNGEAYAHGCQPLISKELFDKVQHKKQKNGSWVKYKKREFLYGNFVKCFKCDTFLYAQETKGRNYYYCKFVEARSIDEVRHKSIYINEEIINAIYVMPILDKLSESARLLSALCHVDSFKEILFIADNALNYFKSRDFKVRKMIIGTLFESISAFDKEVHGALKTGFQKIIECAGDVELFKASFRLSSSSEIELMSEIRNLFELLTDVEVELSGDVRGDILILTKNSASIDEIVEKLHIPISEAQDILFDLMMDSKIEEVSPGIWKNK